MSPSTLLLYHRFSCLKPGIPSKLTKWLGELELEPKMNKNWDDVNQLHSSVTAPIYITIHPHGLLLAWIRVSFFGLTCLFLFFSFDGLLSQQRCSEPKIELFLTISSEYGWNSFHIENTRKVGCDICHFLCYSFPSLKQLQKMDKQLQSYLVSKLQTISFCLLSESQCMNVSTAGTNISATAAVVHSNTQLRDIALLHLIAVTLHFLSTILCISLCLDMTD